MSPSQATYVIRRADVADAGAIAAVHVRSWQSSYPGVLPKSFLDGLSVKKQVERWKHRIIEFEGITFVGATAEGDVVGFCDAGPNREEESRFPGEIYAIYLLDEAKRRGLGRALFVAAQEWLRQNEMAAFEVWVLASNAPARSFYERLGGRRVAETQLSIAGQTHAEIAYAWSG